MSDQPEKVGFEAFFETSDFMKGVRNYLDGIDKVSNATGNLFDIVNAVSEETNAIPEALRQMRLSNAISGMEGDISSSFSEVFDKAGKKSGDSLIGALLGTVIGGGNARRAGASIGAVIGQAIGNAITPGFGGIVGGAVGGAVGGIGGIRGLLAGLFGPIGMLANTAINAFGKLLNVFSVVGKAGKSAFDIVIKGISGAIKVAGAFASALYTGIVGVLGIIGNRARNVFQDLFGSLDQLVDQAKELQVVEVGINSLVRAALVLEGQFSTATEAIAAAIPISKELNQILVDMSLASPFTLQDVYEIFRTNAAFGIALDTSVELTEAMLNLGAATGFSSSVLERIARNFAQIARNGRIFQRDVYELANAGIDLAAILQQELGMSIEEVNQGLQRGDVAVKDLFRSLINFSKTTYGQSAEDLSNTLVGLENRLKTIGTLVVRDFMRPILERAVPAIQTLAQALVAVQRSGVFQVIGDHVARMMRIILGDIDWTVESIATGIMRFMLWLAQQSNVMLEHGFGMMEAWGTGMLEGAMQAITAVANFIANAISSLFSTHSPPAILPMIDVWGAETIEAWLEGMTNADFGILNDLVGTISSILQNIGFEKGSIQGVLQRVVQAVSDGGIGAGLDVFGNIATPFSGQIGDVISVYQKLAKAENELAKQMQILEERTKAVERAQKALEDAMQFYEDSDTAVQKLVREYNELLRAGANEDVLKAKQNEIDAMMDQRTQAAMAIEEAEKQVDVAKEARDKQKDIVDEHKNAVDIIEEQLDKEKAILDLMIKLTEKIDKAKENLSGVAEQLSNMEGVVAGIGNLGALTLDFDMSDLDMKLKILSGRIEWELKQFRLRFAAGMISIGNQIAEPFEEMKTQIGEVVTLVGNIKGIKQDVIDNWELFKLKIKLVWQNLELAWKWLQFIKTIVTTPWNLVAIANLGLEIGTLRGEIDETEGSAKLLEDKINLLTNGTFPAYGSALNAAWGELVTTKNKTDDLDTSVGGLGTEIRKTELAWKTAWSNIKTKLDNTNGAIMNKLGNIKGAFGGIGSIISGMLTNLTTFLTKIKNAVIPSWMMRNSPSPIEMTLMGMREHLSHLAHMELPTFNAKMRMVEGSDLVNFQPTPTNIMTPSAIANHNITNNINMGGNIVRDDMDLALIENNMVRQLRRASYGA